MSFVIGDDIVKLFISKTHNQEKYEKMIALFGSTELVDLIYIFCDDIVEKNLVDTCILRHLRKPYRYPLKNWLRCTVLVYLGVGSFIYNDTLGSVFFCWQNICILFFKSAEL